MIRHSIFSSFFLSLSLIFAYSISSANRQRPNEIHRQIFLLCDIFVICAQEKFTFDSNKFLDKQKLISVDLTMSFDGDKVENAWCVLGILLLKMLLQIFRSAMMKMKAPFSRCWSHFVQFQTTEEYSLRHFSFFFGYCWCHNEMNCFQCASLKYDEKDTFFGLNVKKGGTQIVDSRRITSIFFLFLLRQSKPKIKRKMLFSWVKFVWKFLRIKDKM